MRGAGSFYLKFKIPESGKAGRYDIVANSKQGEQTITETKTITQSNLASESLNAISSKGGDCLIATATYDSEMASKVQQLRDHKLLQTGSDTSFISSFNDFYYSFSPIIADYERENLLFKPVKFVITPMISSLSILNYVDMDSDEFVLGYGVSLIVLNVGMYFAAPAIIIYKIQKRF